MRKVISIASTPVTVASPYDNLAYIRKLMLKHDISRVVIVEGDKPVGIVTKTDIVKNITSIAYAKNPRALDEILAEEVMSKKLIVISRNQDVRRAAELMLKHGISSLPVVNSEGKLLGIVTKTDVTRFYAETYKGEKLVKDVMSAPPITIGPNYPITHAIHLMLQNGISRLLVVEGGKLIGIITKTDLSFVELNFGPQIRRRKFVKEVEVVQARRKIVRSYVVPLVSDLMTEDPVCTYEDQDLASAASKMIDLGVSGLPVLDRNDKVVGVVTKTDVVKAVASP